MSRACVDQAVWAGAGLALGDGASRWPNPIVLTRNDCFRQEG